MKRTFTLLLLLLLCLLTTAQGATWWFGGSASDTTFVLYPKWKATLKTCMDAAATTDTLRQIPANSYDSLTTSFSNSESFVIYGNASYTARVAGLKLTTTGVWIVNNLNLQAALCYNAAAAKALTWTGGSIKHPGTGTEDGVLNYGFGLYLTTATLTNVSFPASGVTNSNLGEMTVSNSGAATTAVTFTGCTFACDDIIVFQNSTAGYLRLLNCTFTGSTAESASWFNLFNTFDIDSVAVDGCTFANAVDKNCGWEFNDVKGIRLNENLCSTWGPHGVAPKNPLWHVKESVTASRPKTVLVTDNIVRRTADTAAGSRAWIYGLDKNTSTRLTFTGNFIDSTFASELDYTLYWPVYGDSSVLTDNTIFAGCVYLGAPVAADTAETNLGVGWTFSNNVIDHSDWAPTSGPSTALTWCPSHSTLSGNTIRSERCNHLILLGDDNDMDTGGGTDLWRPADSGWGASHNAISGNTMEQGPVTGTFAVMVADKGRANLGYNNTFTQRGSTDSYSYTWSVSGDSSTCYNNDVTLYDPGTGTNTVFNDARWVYQSKANTYHNNLVRGAADYVFFSSSGNGSGWSETNNCWALNYKTRFDQDGDSMATTSFTDSTSWRRQWGGRGALTGMTDSAQGFQAVGISTASPGQPAISRTQPGFRTPKESLESIRSIGALKGVDLDAYIVTPQDRANLKVWQYGPHPAGGTLQATGADTLRVRTAIR